jgi:2-succinyl-5-enolpyruvyl-6-hydroxy-3-cyclohexene-1-carboxylate synthase
MATVLLDELVRNGIERLVLAPGSRSGALAMAAVSDRRLHVFVAIDERSAGFFALGQAKVTGRPSVVVTTSGTAVANVLPAVIEASESLTPLIVLSADRPFDLRYTGANQTIDQSGIFGRFPRFSSDIPVAIDAAGEAGSWRSLVCHAVLAATNGPVHLNVAFAEPLVPASDDGRDRAAPYRNETSGRSEGAPWIDLQAPQSIGGEFSLTGRDLVVAGGGAEQRFVKEALTAGVPVIAEAHSNCRLPGTITTAHHLLGANFPGLRPERVIMIGRAGLSRPLALLLRSVPQVVVRPEGGDPSRRALKMESIGSFVGHRPDPDWLALWLEAERAAREIIDQHLSATESLSEPQIARDLWMAVPRGGVLAVGSSMPVRDLDWFAPSREGVLVVANRGASGIDGFLSLALGAATASQPAYGLVGDLSLLHDANGLMTTPRPDLTVVVINNNGGGIFSFLPQANFPEHFERVFATPARVELASLASAHGVRHELVGSRSELQGILAETPHGVTLVEARTDRAENVAIHRRLSEAILERLSAIPALKASPRA